MRNKKLMLAVLGMSLVLVLLGTIAWGEEIRVAIQSFAHDALKPFIEQFETQTGICLPYDQKIHQALHDLGFRITYHTCGGTRGIEELIVANGTDASETLAPVSIGGNQEPWEFKEKIGNRLALIGGMDQINVLTYGTPEEIRKTVHTLFERVGYEGGYILSCADHFFDTPPENLRAYVAAARECVY